MTHCDDCIAAQANLSSVKYIRVAGVADIMVVGCPKHLIMFRNNNIGIRFETLEDIQEYSKQ